MGILPIMEMFGFVIGTIIFWSATVVVVGVIWLIYKLIKHFRIRVFAKSEGNQAP